MNDLAAHWPMYGFQTNAGYGTAAHLKALREHGITPQHRLTFRPVAELAASAA
jgi:ribonuclease HII